MKWSAIVVLFAVGALMAYSAWDLPNFADPAGPPHTHLSPRFIEKAWEETHAQNQVTAVLADYRGFDTMFETAVILIAGMAVALILWPAHREDDP